MSVKSTQSAKKRPYLYNIYQESSPRSKVNCNFQLQLQKLSQNEWGGKLFIVFILKMLPIVGLTEKGNTSNKAGSCYYSLVISFYRSDLRK